MDVLIFQNANLLMIMHIINTLYLMTLVFYLTQIMKKSKNFVVLQYFLRNAKIKLIKLMRCSMESIFMMRTGLVGKITKMLSQ